MKAKIEENEILKFLINGEPLDYEDVIMNEGDNSKIMRRIFLHDRLISKLITSLESVAECKDDLLDNRSECGRKAYDNLIDIVEDIFIVLDSKDIQRICNDFMHDQDNE